VGWPAAEDLQLALYVCYEIHYRGFEGVDAEWEWEPTLLAFRRRLERIFEARVTALTGPAPATTADLPVGDALQNIIDGADGPSLSRFMQESGTLDQFREFAVHRSAYQLKEADPHSWALPRLAGRPKAALVEIQSDEYGGGLESRMHANLFADTMAALGLDPTYGAYLDRLPASTLATVNLVSFFGLHRRWRGALVGHLALFEMTSVEPMGRYAAALTRLGVDPAARRFYDVHVEADAHHQIVARTDLATGLAEDEPALAADILFGARALMAVEGRFARGLLDAWADGRSSLRPASR
jgi:hypothetical protein